MMSVSFKEDSKDERNSEVLKNCIEFPIEERKLIEVAQKARDWALMHGAAMRSRIDFNLDAVQIAPFILTPSSFPRKEFFKAVELQPTLNELMHRVAHDEDFLRATLSETVKVDPFTARLFRLYEKTLISPVQPISLGLLRSDLMLETNCSKSRFDIPSKAFCTWKQVEINTIASGFGHLGPASKDLQSYVLGELDETDKLTDMPENQALSLICKGMIKSWEMMEKPSGVILFIVENVTYNICDQRFHEFEIRRLRPDIKVIRRTLTQVYLQHGENDENDLIVDGHVVNVVYFRAGYEPSHYPSESEWLAREIIELSNAIKCPSIQYHLAGTKKVQQALAGPETLKIFFTDADKADEVREIFTGLYSLDNNEAGNAAVKMALEDPERYVLKPQREGGGNNIYGREISKVLKRMSTSERSSWILMDRINPPVTKGYMIRPGGPSPPPLQDLVSELGIFGVIIGDRERIYENYQAGHMLRTKLSTADEGGVAAGLGALDSPYLVDLQ